MRLSVRERRETSETVGHCHEMAVSVTNNLALSILSTLSTVSLITVVPARANVKEIDWLSLIEEYVQRVIAAERTGDPAVDLRTLERPQLDELRIDGLVFPRRAGRVCINESYSAGPRYNRKREGGLVACPL